MYEKLAFIKNDKYLWKQKIPLKQKNGRDDSCSSYFTLSK